MLVLSRKEGETVHIGGGIVVTVTRIQGGRVKLGIDAPVAVGVVRGELKQTVDDFRGGLEEAWLGHDVIAPIAADTRTSSGK